MTGKFFAIIPLIVESCFSVKLTNFTTRDSTRDNVLSSKTQTAIQAYPAEMTQCPIRKTLPLLSAMKHHLHLHQSLINHTETLLILMMRECETRNTQKSSDCDNLNEVLEGVRDEGYSEIRLQSASECDNDKDNSVADSEFDEWKQYDKEVELKVDVMGGK